MTTPKFTLDWPHGWKLRNGIPVHIHRTDALGPFPIQGHVCGKSRPFSWTLNGGYFENEKASKFDLINRPAPLVDMPTGPIHRGILSGILFDKNVKKYLIEVTSGPEWADLGKPVFWCFDERAIENLTKENQNV